MPLVSPNLDDRDFRQLLDEASSRIKQSCPAWTDFSPANPGMTLLELFAYLTETMIYRLNRVPDKLYIEFLRLIGIRLQPPSAASVALLFTRARAEDQPLQIPRGIRVTLSRPDSSTDALIFTTAEDATIPGGSTQVEVRAHHCDLVEGELAGVGTGLPGLVVNAQRPPIVASTGDALDLVVGVEAEPNELGGRISAIEYEGKTYRVWRQVENFTTTGMGDDQYVYLVDRMSGMVIFAPAARLEKQDGELTATPEALAAVPAKGREIRLWYRRGGGPEGNVEANTLTRLKDALNGLQVTNPAAAVGGRAAETLENALIRGPQQLHSLQRAVTARDFELVALYDSRVVARTKAMTQASLWSYALSGTVEVLLVPFISEEMRSGGQVTVQTLQDRQTNEALEHVRQTLDERRPLGTTCVVNWAHYKTVRVTAKIAVRREEDLQAVRQRVIERLYQTINPLPTQFSPTGWPFGQALRVSHIYDVALAEPGVLWVEQVRLLVDEVPDGSVSVITADATQRRTWYAGSGSTLFRSFNDGDGWEPAGRFTNEEIMGVKSHPDRAGFVAVATRLPNNAGSRVYVSRDCAETWDTTIYSLSFQVQDLAWLLRGGEPLLLLATNVGLYELTIQPGSSPVPVLVDKANQTLGFYAVVAGSDARGNVNVAVAAQNNGGIYFSNTGGSTNTYRQIGLSGQAVRELVIENDGPRSFLWAGIASAGGDDPGKGCFTWEILGSENPQEGWQGFGKNWAGGTCHALTFLGNQVLAASHRSGVLRLDLHARDAAWQAPTVDSGLPMRDQGRFLPVLTLATDPDARLLLVGGSSGVLRRMDTGEKYVSLSKKELDKVTLPPTWLFVSGAHDITVESEDEADRN